MLNPYLASHLMLNKVSRLKYSTGNYTYSLLFFFFLTRVHNNKSRNFCFHCFFPTELLTQVEYTVDVELNVTDIRTLNYLRSILSNGSFSLALSPTVNVTDINITTGQNGASSDLNTMDADFVNHGTGCQV